jgi:hypothetical protein
MKCEYCKENDAIKYSKYSSGRFCSKKCSNTYSSNLKRDEVNKKVSETMKEKYSNLEYYNKWKKRIDEKIYTEEEREQISKKWKLYYKNNPDAIKRIINDNSKRVVTSEIKEKLSKIMTEKILKGNFKPKLNSIRCLYKFRNLEIKCDSKVEYSCLNYFETNFDVKNIERVNFSLKFEFDNVIRNYIPDFKIELSNGDIYIIECKTILSNNNLKRKWKYYYDTIEIKKETLKKFCKEKGYKDFFYTKKLNLKYYNNLKIVV